jgi:hypothetical protein
LVFAIVVACLVWGLPESPRWLCRRGRSDKAREVLCTMLDLDENDAYVCSEMDAIGAAISIETGEGAQKVTGLFKKDILQTGGRCCWRGSDCS